MDYEDDELGDNYEHMTIGDGTGILGDIWFES
jgi:hypothetical protein